VEVIIPFLFVLPVSFIKSGRILIIVSGGEEGETYEQIISDVAKESQSNYNSVIGYLYRNFL
jgi:hypothetical protein